MLFGAANSITGVLPRGLCQELWLRVLELDVGTPLERLWRPRKLRPHSAPTAFEKSLVLQWFFIGFSQTVIHYFYY